MILNQLCTMSNTVHFVCDTYVTPSLKTSERDRRGAQDMSFAVTGTDQKRPKDWQRALQSPSFNNAFFRYLADDWKSSRHADTLRNHDVYLAIDGERHHFTEEEGVVYHKLLHQYGCQHEEADTRLIFHLRQTHTAYQVSDLQYVVRSNDTDVMVLLLYHVSHFQVTPRVWMDAGLSGGCPAWLARIQGIRLHRVLHEQGEAETTGYHAERCKIHRGVFTHGRGQHTRW